jgi:proteasome lid subunit RPN8/RPN11
VKEVSIDPAVLEDIIAHAREEAPNECCGLLVGPEKGILEQSVRTTNLEQSPTAFLIDPRQHIRANRAARAEGRSVVGFYHSHVKTPAVPSPTDVARAWYPGYAYLIVSLADGTAPEVVGYVLDGGNFAQVSFVPLPDEHR